MTERNSDNPLVDEIIIVVGHNSDSIINYVGDSYNSVPVKYVHQNVLGGIAHAVLTAKEALNDDFILCLADEILFHSRLKEMVDCFTRSKNQNALCGVVIDAEDFSMKPIAYDIDEKSQVKMVREKPEYYSNDIRGIGECIFSKKSLDLLPELKPNQKRNELEMGDWIQMIVDRLGNVGLFNLADGYMNVNYAEDIKIANEKLKGISE